MLLLLSLDGGNDHENHSLFAANMSAGPERLHNTIAQLKNTSWTIPGTIHISSKHGRHIQISITALPCTFICSPPGTTNLPRNHRRNHCIWATCVYCKVHFCTLYRSMCIHPSAYWHLPTGNLSVGPFGTHFAKGWQLISYRMLYATTPGSYSLSQLCYTAPSQGHGNMCRLSCRVTISFLIRSHFRVMIEEYSCTHQGCFLASWHNPYYFYWNGG